jgi:glutaredoxin 3
MPDVTMYTTRTCPYCVAAKRLLSTRAIAFEEVDVTGDQEKRDWLVEASGRRTVPQIFIRGRSIGGYDELAALDRTGELRAMLDASAPAVEPIEPTEQGR